MATLLFEYEINHNLRRYDEDAKDYGMPYQFVDCFPLFDMLEGKYSQYVSKL